jgi:hypothetical protein
MSYLECITTTVLHKLHKNGTNHTAIMTKYKEHPLKIQSERLRVSVKIVTIYNQMTAIH